MYRFEATLGLFVYPQTNDDEPKELRLNRGYKFKDVDNVTPRDDVRVIKCGVTIPQNAVDYIEFRKQMETSEKKFLAKLYL